MPLSLWKYPIEKKLKNLLVEAINNMNTIDAPQAGQFEGRPQIIFVKSHLKRLLNEASGFMGLGHSESLSLRRS